MDLDGDICHPYRGYNSRYLYIMLLWTWMTIYVIHAVVMTINMDLNGDICHPYRCYNNK